MADISQLAVLQNAIVTNLDLSTNALVVGSVKVGATELTEAILGNLINLQNGSDFADGNSSHTHDGRYRTQTELSSIGATSGADLIGVRDDGAFFTGSDLEEILQEIGALVSAVVDAANVTYSPAVLANWTGAADPGNVDGALDQLAARQTTTEGQVSTNTSDIAARALDTEVLKKDGSVPLEGNMDLGGNRFSNAGAPVNPNDLVRLVDLQAVESAGGLGKAAVKASTTGNLTGYNASGGTAGNGSFTGVSMTQDTVVLVNNDRLVVPFQTDKAQNGIYVVVDDTTGTIERASDADGTPASEVQGGNSVFVDLGATYANTVFQLKGQGELSPGNDDQDWVIYSRVENIQDGQGLTRNGTILGVETDSNSLGFNGSEQLEVKFSGSTIEKDGSGIKVSDGGIGTTQIADDAVTKEKVAADVAGAGLGQNVDGSLEVNADDTTIEVVGDAIQVKDGGIADVKAASGSKLEQAIQFHTNSDITGAEAETLTDGSNADALHSHDSMKSTRLAGEAFGANITKVVRWGKDGETAGRIYAADSGVASANNFRGIGLQLDTSAVSAGANATITRRGTHTLGAGDTNFAAADVGKTVYLSTTGDFTLTAPTAVGTVVYEVGQVEDINKIDVMFRLIGVN
jgi:hypothetical protein